MLAFGEPSQRALLLYSSSSRCSAVLFWLLRRKRFLTARQARVARIHTRAPL